MIIQLITFGIAIEVYIFIFMIFMHYLSNRDTKKEKDFSERIKKQKIKGIKIGSSEYY